MEMPMKFSNVYISAIGYELPPVVVTSGDIETRLKPMYDKLHISQGQLKALTGIEERRWWPENYSVSEGAYHAAVKALKKASFDPGDLDMLLYTGVCREHYEPATACHVAGRIGGFKRNAWIYDISNACLGVLNGIVEIANRIELGQIRAGMVISCETAREITDVVIRNILEKGTMDYFRYSLATLTGGSGAIAVLVTDKGYSENGRRRVLGGAAGSAPEHHWLCRWGTEKIQEPDVFRPFMTTDSVEVFKNGVALGKETWDSFITSLDWTPDMIDRVICHQVGSGHRDMILKLIGIDPEKDFSTFPFLGNIGTVSLPITAALAEERDFLESGHRVAMLGIGSGLNCMMLGVEW